MIKSLITIVPLAFSFALSTPADAGKQRPTSKSAKVSKKASKQKKHSQARAQRPGKRNKSKRLTTLGRGQPSGPQPAILTKAPPKGKPQPAILTKAPPKGKPQPAILTKAPPKGKPQPAILTKAPPSKNDGKTKSTGKLAPRWKLPKR